jgi:hypothetical protein
LHVAITCGCAARKSAQAHSDCSLAHLDDFVIASPRRLFYPRYDDGGRQSMHRPGLGPNPSIRDSDAPCMGSRELSQNNRIGTSCYSPRQIRSTTSCTSLPIQSRSAAQFCGGLGPLNAGAGARKMPVTNLAKCGSGLLLSCHPIEELASVLASLCLFCVPPLLVRFLRRPTVKIVPD